MQQPRTYVYRVSSKRAKYKLVEQHYYADTELKLHTYKGHLLPKLPAYKEGTHNGLNVRTNGDTR